MLAFALTARGVFAARTGQAEPLLAQASAGCLRGSLNEWATGRGSTATKLADRLAPSAFQVYGFAKRSAKYMKAQRKALGAPRPYYSPRSLDISRLAVAALRGKANALVAAAKHLVRQEHMASLIVRPGGFTLVSTVNGKTARVVIKYPGARALNQGGAKNAIFRQELADWSKGGGRDARAVLARAQELFDRDFAAQFARLGTRKIA